MRKLVHFSLFWFGTKEGKEKVNELKGILAEFKRNIQNIEDLAEERGIIELIFKCTKEILLFDNLHRYTKKSGRSNECTFTGARYSIGNKEKGGGKTLN